jgi:hypothetical protein
VISVPAKCTDCFTTIVFFHASAVIYSMSAPAFGSALDKPLGGGYGYDNSYSSGDGQQKDTVPLVEGIAVSLPEAMPSGQPIFAGLELWIPPKPNVYQDGLPVYEVRVR